MSSSDHASKAAELAAQQVEAIVEAAQAAAADIESGAEKKLEAQRAQLEAEFASRQQALEEEIGRIRKEAVAAAEKARSEAEAYATTERRSADEEARRLRDDSRREAAERVVGAEKAADEALADARAVSGGLKRLGQALEEHAERILRDVQAGHKRLQADLRVAARGPGSSSSEEPAPRRRAPESGASATERAPRSARRRPFDDIDLPEWVAGDGE
jgi:hypothetical protein